MRVLGWPARSNASRNPYQRLLYDALELTGDVRVVDFGLAALASREPIDVLHLHWPDAFLGAGGRVGFWVRKAFLRGVLAYVHLRNGKVVWTVHNLDRSTARGSRKVNDAIRRILVPNLDAAIVMNEVSSDLVVARFPELARKPIALIRHGRYDVVAGTQRVQPTPVPQLVVFGTISSYKGTSGVVKSFGLVPPGALALKIAGRLSRRDPDHDFSRVYEAASRIHGERLRWHDDWLTDEELTAAIQESIGAVFNYDQVLNSGAAIYALSVGRPILTTDAPAFRELRRLVGPDWVWLTPNGLGPDNLVRFAGHAQSLLATGKRPPLESFEWGPIASATRDLFSSVSAETSVAPPAGEPIAIRIVHQTDPFKYFPALDNLSSAGRIELRGRYRYSVLKEWFRSWLKERRPLKDRLQYAQIDARFRLQMHRLNGEVVVVGCAPWDWRFLWYGRLVRRNVVLYHTSWSAWDGRAGPRRYGPLTKPIRRRWLELLRSDRVAVVAVTESGATQLAQNLAIDSRCIPHAVPEAFFRAGEQRQENPSSNLRLLFVGELAAKKGIGTLLTLMRSLRNEPVELTIVGDGPLRKSCQTAQQAGLVRFQGRINDRTQLATLMAEHDVLVLLSRRQKQWQELFGIVIVEAAAAGLGIIASDHAGPRAILTSVDAPDLFDEDDAAGVRELIVSLARDPMALRAFRSAHSGIAETYREHRVSELWFDAIEAASMRLRQA
jgi:glycosyltransferase involved in cell wall biosynthesis